MKNLKKLTKKGLVEYLKTAEDKIKDDSSLVDRIVYTLSKAGKDLKSILKADLLDLADEVQNTLEAQKIVGAVENSTKDEEEIDIKKVPKKAKAKAKVKKEEAKAKVKKEEAKEKEEANDKPKAVKGNESKSKELAENFPSTVLVGEEEYSINLELKSIDDVVKAIEGGTKVVFAFYWTKRHLKQFPYDNYGICTKKVTEFPQDLDLAQVIYPTREGTALYLVSLYTDIMHIVMADELEIEDNMRFCNGVEYNIYTK